MEERVRLCLGYCVEDQQLLLPYLLLAASCQWDPLELAFIDLAKAYDWLPMATLWLMLAE